MWLHFPKIFSPGEDFFPNSEVYLVSKRTIIVPIQDLASIIKSVTGGNVEIYTDDNPGCCVAKVSPIQKVDAIKIVTESGEIVTDFKQVYNKEFNDLVNVYHLCLKYVVV